MAENEDLEQELEQDADQGSDDEDEFDKERAMDTIRKQRESEKAALSELKAAKKRLAELEKAESERAKAELSEKERLEAELAEAQQAAEKAAAELETRQSEFNKRLIRAEVRVMAATMQFASPDDAYHLADLSEVKIADDGAVQGVETALKALAKDKPYLLSEDGDRSPGTPPRSRKVPAGKAGTPERRVDDERPIIRF